LWNISSIRADIKMRGEVVREGLRLLERREAEDEARLSALRQAAQVALDDLDAGRYRTLQTREALREHLATLTKAAIGRSDE
jgi:antitoxin ParD1/3/4